MYDYNPSNNLKYAIHALFWELSRRAMNKGNETHSIEVSRYDETECVQKYCYRAHHDYYFTVVVRRYCWQKDNGFVVEWECWDCADCQTSCNSMWFDDVTTEKECCKAIECAWKAIERDFKRAERIVKSYDDVDAL